MSRCASRLRYLCYRGWVCLSRNEKTPHRCIAQVRGFSGFEGLLDRAQQSTETILLGPWPHLGSGCSTGIASTAKHFQLTRSRELFWCCDSGLLLTTANEETQANEAQSQKSSHYCSSVLVTTPSAIEDMFWNAT